MRKTRLLITVMAALILCCQATFARHYEQADSLIEACIADSTIPGAVLCVIDGGQIVCRKAYGHRSLVPRVTPMKKNTVFDLASVSKVVGTGMTAMTLIEEGKLDLDAPVNRYLPDYEGDATIRDLMTHVSGLPAYAQWSTLLKDHPNAGKAERRQILLNHVCHVKRQSAPRTEFCYSCLNFITLQYVMETITGQPLNELAEERVFRPLNMRHTGYNPGPSHDIAPTEIQPDGLPLLGNVHDPLARVMNSGVSGNAGVFSSAGDLARMAKWILDVYHGRKAYKLPFNAETLRLMTRVPAGYEAFGRALAWDMLSDYNGCRGHYCSPTTICHSGYTGTSIVIDLERDKAIILLTNRVHPHDVGNVLRLRREVADAIFK